MPTIRVPRLNTLPQLRNKEDDGLGIKGSDILRNNLKVKAPLPSPEPVRSEKVKSSEDWRPASAVRKLGEICPLPTLEESAADVMSLARASRLLSADKHEIKDIREMFSGVMSKEISGYVAPLTRSVACSPMSSWTSMSEDLLEHVSQRVATEQQMSLSSRDTTRQLKSPSFFSNSLRMTPCGVIGGTESPKKFSAQSKQRPRTAGSSTTDRKRSNFSRPTSASVRPPSSRRSPSSAGPSSRTISSRPVTRASSSSTRPSSASAKIKPITSRPSSVAQSYRESLSETGIQLPSRAIERLVSAFEKDHQSTESRRSCTRSSNDSRLAQDLLRKKIHQGYNDMLKAFEVYDRNSTGIISRSEFAAVLGHFTVDLTRKQLHKLLDRSGMSIDWDDDKIPYQLFLRKYLEKGRGGCLKSPASSRPQTGDSGRAELAETRLLAQLHSDFVDVLEAFRAHDVNETGQIALSDFRNIMSDYGLKVPDDNGDQSVNYLEYLRSVSELPDDESGLSPKRPQTAPAQMAIQHAYTGCEEDNDFPFQQLSLNLRPVHMDPRAKALVNLENCKLIKGGTRRPNRNVSGSLQGQLTRKFGTNRSELRRLMQIYDTGRDGNISIGHFRDLLAEFDINIDENDFYNVVNKYDSSFRGVIPYKKLLSEPSR